MRKKTGKLLILVLVLCLSGEVAIAADIDTGLTGYWPFDEGSGTTTADMSLNGNDGTFVGTPLWETGIEGFGNCLFFDKDSGRTTADGVFCGTFDPSEGSANGEFTLAMWAYWMATPKTAERWWSMLMSKIFVDKTNTYEDSMFAWVLWSSIYGEETNELNDRIGIYHYGTDGTVALSSGTMPEKEWVHLAVTYDGTYLQLYINGIADDPVDQEWAPGPNTGAEFNIGRNTQNCYSGRRLSFDGYLDEARTYNRVLSPEDIMELTKPDPDFNFAPKVDAGDYQSLLWPDNLVQLDATVSDDGRPYQESPPADPCTPIGLTLTWSQISGSGVVIFSDTTIEDPTVTFPAAGYYELQLNAFDGEKEFIDVVAIQVRADNDPIARWNFEEGSGTNVGDSSAYNNVGTLMGDEPNWVPGWVDDWALECSDNSYMAITMDSTVDPNLDSQKYEITVAAWVKVDGWGSVGSWNGIVTKGDGGGGWSLIRYSNTDGLAFYAPDAGFVGGSVSVRDGYWHHVAAVHDGVTTSLYVDGVLDASAAASGLISTNAAEVWINGNSDYPGDRFFAGMIDDVRIYLYGLNDIQVADLAAMGALVPTVDAGVDQMSALQLGALQLDATVTDDGKPEAATLAWTADPCNAVSFSDDTIEDPTVTFSEVGTYVLRLTANDTTSEKYDEVTITIENPVCADVIDRGLLMPADISGPEGLPDCRVDLYDFAVISSYWLNCNDPQDPECDFPY